MVEDVRVDCVGASYAQQFSWSLVDCPKVLPSQVDLVIATRLSTLVCVVAVDGFFAGETWPQASGLARPCELTAGQVWEFVRGTRTQVHFRDPASG